MMPSITLINIWMIEEEEEEEAITNGQSYDWMKKIDEQ